MGINNPTAYALAGARRAARRFRIIDEMDVAAESGTTDHRARMSAIGLMVRNRELHPVPGRLGMYRSASYAS